MANGDIEFEHISEDEFKQFAPEHREWLLYKSTRSLSATCHVRPKNCDQRYIKKRHIFIALAVLVALLIGAGYKIDGVIEMMVKAALAGAL